MSPPPFPVAAEELLRHRAWVRSLARTLVRDEAAVDDIEQDTWLAAVERPPAHGEAATTWLGRVVRSRAIDLFRRRSRRVARESAAARPEAVPSAAETVARADAHRRVVDAVMALDEPFRTAVLLRFFEDLPPREIARRTGVPAETARTRVRRGVERLRAQFTRGPGDRGDGRNALLLLLAAPGGREPATATGGAVARGSGLGTGGMLTMTIGTKAGTGAAVVALVAGWLVFGRGDDPAAGPSPAPGVGDDAAGADGVATARPGARATRPAADANASAPAPGTAGDPPPAAPATTRLRIRREDGASVDGAAVVLHDDTRILRSARLGAGGEFDAGPPAKGRRIVVVTEGRVPQSLVVPDAPGDAELVLPAGAAVAGRVLLRGESPGEPVEVSLWLDGPVVPAAILRRAGDDEGAPFPNVQGATVRTAPDGTFRVAGFVSGARGSAGPEWGWTPSDPDAGRFTAPAAGIVIDCTRKPRVTGRLVRRGTRAPIAGATVVLSHRDETSGSSTRVTSGPDGRFAVYISHVRPPEAFVVDVSEADGVPSGHTTVRGPFDRDCDTGTIEIADPWADTRRIRVLDEAGRPVTGAFAAADDESGWCGAASAGDGVVTLPATIERVVIAASGFEHATAPVPSGTGVADVTLRTAASLTVSVASGSPERAVVRVSGPHPSFDEPAAPVAAAVRRRLGTARDDANVRDADGRDVSWFRAAGTLTLPCVRPGVPLRIEVFDAVGEPLEGVDITLTAAESRTVTLTSRPHRALRGRVTGPDGRPVAGASVVVRSPRADDSLAWSGGWREWAECGDDGAFEVAGLCGATVTAVASAPGFVPWASRDARPGGDPVVIRLVRGLRLRVRAVAADGTPVAAGMVRASVVDPGPWDGLVEGFETAEQADGSWIVDGLPPGEVSLSVGPEDAPAEVVVRTDRGSVDVVLPAAAKEE